jgi:hypothetical protein
LQSLRDVFDSRLFTFAVRHCDDHLASHPLALHVRVSIILACVVVAVLTGRFVRRETLQPPIIVVMQTRLIVVDEDRGGDVCMEFASPSQLPLRDFSKSYATLVNAKNFCWLIQIE